MKIYFKGKLYDEDNPIDKGIQYILNKTQFNGAYFVFIIKDNVFALSKEFQIIQPTHWNIESAKKYISLEEWKFVSKDEAFATIPKDKLFSVYNKILDAYEDI